MNIRLTPHSQEILKEQLAQGRFRSPEEVIEHALETLAEGTQRRTTLDLAEFEATLDALAEGSERLPVLPSEATNRAGIYHDHD
jgi:Arc/MetJ-type ribon-helix-helix transcriptional regulator